MNLKYFSQHYEIAATGDEDWFDPRMSLDTPLYIDPFMVFKSDNPVFSNAKEKFFDFFKTAFELAHEATFSKTAYKKLETILKFPEVKEVCLGVSKKGTSGSGSGGGYSKGFAEALVKLAKAGYDGITHFEEIEIFTVGIGKDRISDATANIIKPELIEYTQNICKQFNIPTSYHVIRNTNFDFEYKRWEDCTFSLPKNPFFDKEQRALILVPTELLRAFHAIGSDSFAEYISGHKNEELRIDLNYEIKKELKKADINKKLIVDLAQRYPNWVSDFKNYIENEAEIKPYNLEIDRKNIYRNEKKASEFIIANPLNLSASNEQEFVNFLELIVQQCKMLIEEQEGYKLLWDAFNQLSDLSDEYCPRSESDAQNLFAEIILGYCETNNISIFKESEVCKKVIGFTFTSGYKNRAVIKLTLARNIPLKQDSLEKFLLDVIIKDTNHNYYLAIAYTAQELEHLEKVLKKIELMNFDDKQFKLIIVNAALDKLIGKQLAVSSSSSIPQSTAIHMQTMSTNIILSGQKRKKLQDALIAGFPTKSKLEQMLSFELDRNLDSIAGGDNLQTIVFNLIKEAEAYEWLQDLVSAAHNLNPENSQLKTIAEELLSNSNLETSFVAETNNSLKEMNQLQKILILSAIPHGLRLDKEIREIEEAIRRSVNRDLFEIRIRTAVRPQDIRRAIAEEEPQIVHFCGHGLEDGSIVLEDEGGNEKPIVPEGLASLFELHTDYVKCVLLNSCYSEKPAVAISQYINYAIGMNQPIEDKAAIAFAQGFYDGLSYKKSTNKDVFQRAFDEAMVAIKMENISQGQLPVLKKSFK